MRLMIAVLLLAASPQVLASGKCPATEDDLRGSWATASGDGFFEVFSLSTEPNSRRFDSWLHQRPDISGAIWALEDCELVVKPQSGGIAPFRLEVVSLKEGVLQLRNTSDQTTSTYRRLPSEP